MFQEVQSGLSPQKLIWNTWWNVRVNYAQMHWKLKRWKRTTEAVPRPTYTYENQFAHEISFKEQEINMEKLINRFDHDSTVEITIIIQHTQLYPENISHAIKK